MISSQDGSKKIYTTEIAETFKKYYSSLYNLNTRGPGQQLQLNEDRMKICLSQSGLPSLSTITFSLLDTPFTDSELA